MIAWAEAAPLAVLTPLALATLLVAASSRRWLQGAPARVRVLAGLAAMPRRYLVDLHAVVARKPANARFHVLTAGGFVSSLLLLLLLLVPGLPRSPVWLLTAAATLVMLAGSLLVARRRYPERPPELSRGRWQLLPIWLVGYALGMFVLALSQLFRREGPNAVAGAALLISAIALLQLALWSWRGPLRHVTTGALHLAFHPRPARFSDRGAEVAADLEPLELDRAKLGAERPVDFPWNRLLGFDACVQCGRCEVACPAFAAGQPLNPKKLIQDLATALGPAASDAGYAGRGYPGRPLGAGRGGPELPLVGAEAMVPAETLWSCVTCRACVEECPMFIEHVDAVVDLRRFQVMELGAVPDKAALALDELRATDTVSGRSLASRLDWAADLGLRRLADRDSCDVLLWVGEGGFDLRNQRTLRALVKLLRLAAVDVAALGEEELDTGDVARRLGDEATFQDLARRNIATLGKYRFNRIVTADPHSLHVLKNEYPAFGGICEVVHHTTLLAELVKTGKLQPKSLDGTRVTYHDPCYLGRYNGEFASPRALLDAVGVDRMEMERSGRRSHCCGGGGGAPLADIPGKRRIPDMRMDQARATGAEIVAVACPNCALMLEGVVGPRPAVVDVAELLLEAVERRP